MPALLPRPKLGASPFLIAALCTTVAGLSRPFPVLLAPEIRPRRPPFAAASMHPGRHRHRGGGGTADADFVGTGFALVLGAVSCLLLVVVGGGGGDGQPASTAGMEWQVILAFGTMAGGLLLIMHGIRARGARPPVLVRRVAGAAGAVLWHAGGPERLLPVLALLLLPFLEAWFDFF